MCVALALRKECTESDTHPHPRPLLENHTRKSACAPLESPLKSPPSSPPQQHHPHPTSTPQQNKHTQQKKQKPKTKGLGLDEAPDKPLVAVVTRLVPQKGIHLIKAALYRTLERGGQFVLLGSGHSDAEFRALAGGDFKDHPDCRFGFFCSSLCVCGGDDDEVPHTPQLNKRNLTKPNKTKTKRLLILYSEALAHQIYAAADAVLVPSMFEPCGLTQMIGMRYGAVPVVRRTGGLADTVFDVDAEAAGGGKRANGYVFDGADASDLHGALDRALALYKGDRPAWAALSASNMESELR